MYLLCVFLLKQMVTVSWFNLLMLLYQILLLDSHT